MNSFGRQGKVLPNEVRNEIIQIKDICSEQIMCF